MSLYSESERAMVFEMWERGLSASLISAKFGYGTDGKPIRTRNAIISLIHRKLPDSARLQHKSKATRRRTSGLPPLKDVDPKLRQNGGQFRVKTPPEPPVVEAIPNLNESDNVLEVKRVKIENLEPYDCRWPLGDDPRTDEDFGFCGCRQFMGVKGQVNYGRSQYCLTHYRKSLRKEWLGPFEKALARYGEVRSP